ncbi:hypothetical protein ABZU86_31510 [Streptomyces sp. NPDC005271]|uniref:hypothetical protein n=1 Tax=unclassified Streptomyces TaxID=2593676 RepID=UPI0033A4EDD0
MHCASAYWWPCSWRRIFCAARSIAGAPEPWYVFDSPAAVLARIESVAAEFDPVAFLDKGWTVSEDARAVFLQVNGDNANLGITDSEAEAAARAR